MRIIDCFGTGRPVFSFEFFPPKTDEGVRNLFATLAELAPLQPEFVSVTYGAGGATRELTVDLTARIKRELGLEAMAHLTCVGHSAGEIAAILDRLKASGVENVLALRGDPPKGETAFARPADGFGYAHELIAFIRSHYDFCLGGACYPEGHLECADLEADLRHLKLKVEAGAEFLITQLFFDPSLYFRFVERAREFGITAPVLPGIMPITNASQIKRLSAMCGASIPQELAAQLEAAGEDEQAVVAVGMDWATEQCRALLEGGAPGIHFYTLNRSLSTRMVYQRLQAG